MQSSLRSYSRQHNPQSDMKKKEKPEMKQCWWGVGSAWPSWKWFHIIIIIIINSIIIIITILIIIRKIPDHVQIAVETILWSKLIWITLTLSLNSLMTKNGIDDDDKQHFLMTMTMAMITKLCHQITQSRASLLKIFLLT